MPQIAHILAHCSSISVLIPLFFLMKKGKNKDHFPSNTLGILLFASAISDLASYILIKNSSPHNIVLNLYTIAEFFTLSYLFYFLLKGKKIIYLLYFIFFIAIFIVNTMFIQPLTEFQSWPLLLETLFILFYSIAYYRQVLKITPPIDLLRSPLFWLNTAIFFYFAFDFFLFAVSNYIFTKMSGDIRIMAWSFHNFNNIVKNILFSVAIGYVGVKQESFGKAMKTY